MTVHIEQRAFTVEEYHRMAESGILGEDDRVELIEGKVITMSPIGSRHAGCVNHINALLHQQLGTTVVIAVQNPIRLNDYSEPMPDITVLRARADFYGQSHPTAADVLLVIEVADTSEEYDRKVKIPLYVQAGISQAWLVSLSQNLVEVYSHPQEEGYRDVRQVKSGEVLTSESCPQLSLAVDEVLS